jgi:hypothetical protein
MQKEVNVVDDNSVEEELAARREVLKRLGLLSGVVAGIVFPVLLSGCPITWVNGPPVLDEKGRKQTRE